MYLYERWNREEGEIEGKKITIRQERQRGQDR